jgi:hypothetical protein
MSEVLLTGDQIMVPPPLGAATPLAPTMLPIVGSGQKLKVTGRAAAVKDDLAKIPMPAPYIAAADVIPGVLLEQADKETPAQLAKKLKIGGKEAVLKAPVDIVAKTTAPAQQPTAAGPVPDAHPQYKGPAAGKPQPVMPKLNSV